MCIKGDEVGKDRDGVGVCKGKEDNGNKWEKVGGECLFNRERGLNGDLGRGSGRKGIEDGGMVVRWKVLGESLLEESWVESLDIEKLGGSIRLGYMEKI